MVQKINAVLSDLQERTQDLTPVLDAIAGVIGTAIDRNFAEGGRWDGSGTDILSGGTQKWVDLAENTKKAYDKNGKGWSDVPTLHRSTSGLRDGISAEPRGESSVGITANKPHSAIHQFGGPIAGTFTVKEHTRFVSQAFGEPIPPRDVTVKSHSRTVNYEMPARPFVTLTEEDLQDILDLISGNLTL